MTHRASGHCATKLVGDASFLAHLGAGTYVTFTISGKLGGTLNGLPISGSGTLEYTFRYGASVWDLDSDGLASGPALPAGPIVYLPSGAAGNASVQSSGTLDTSGVFTHQKDKYHFKLKGRTASITVGVFSDTPTCDVTSVDCSTDCATFSNDATCQQDCVDVQTASGC